MDCHLECVSLCVILRSSPGGVIKLPCKNELLTIEGIQPKIKRAVEEVERRFGWIRDYCVFSVTKTLYVACWYHDDENVI